HVTMYAHTASLTVAVVSFLFFLMIPPPPTSTLFPYTTLFRSPRTNSPMPQSARTRPACRSEYPGNSRSDSPALPPRQCPPAAPRSEEHTSELQSLAYLVCRLLLEKKKKNNNKHKNNKKIHSRV